MKKLNVLWKKYTVIASIPALFFLINYARAEALGRHLFEYPVIEGIFMTYLFPGVLPSALFFGTVRHALALTDNVSMSLMFFTANILAVFFWGTIFWLGHNAILRIQTFKQKTA